MQRKRISAAAFEGLLWLQQQDEQRRQKLKQPQRKRLILPTDTGVALPSAWQPEGVALPPTARFDKRNFQYGRSA